MKLLAICDSPMLQTGFARVASNLMLHWRHQCQRLDVWAIGYNGYPGAPGKRSRWTQDPITLYPASPDPSVPWHSTERLQALLNHILRGDYTHVWIMQDHFLLAHSGFADALRLACTSERAKLGLPRIKTYYYVPIDAPIEPDWAAPIDAVDFPVAYTQYGKDEILKYTGRLPGCCPQIRILPHGVDPRIYRPLPDREKLRAELSCGWIQPGDFVLLNVNANQRRKDVTRSLDILKELRERWGPRFKLLMHMAEKNNGQLSLETYARQLGFRRGREWDHTGEGFVGVHARATEENLNQIYNLADLLMSTSLGEGWGLSTTEALAAGCPVAVPANTSNWSIHAELDRLQFKQRMWLLPQETHGVAHEFDNSRLRYRTDVGEAVRIIYSIAQAPPARVHLTSEVAAWLDWKRIAGEWMRLFKADPPPEHHYLEYGGGLGDVFQGMYTHGSANLLATLPGNARATVVLRCHNPGAQDIFKHHPNHAQFDVRSFGYCDPENDAEDRQNHGLPRAGLMGRLRTAKLPTQIDWLTFVDPAQRERLLQLIGESRSYYVLAPGAGMPDRNLPEALIAQILALAPGRRLLWVGSTYQRHDRYEPTPRNDPRIVNLVDQLSVPETAALVQHARGLITCHSAWSMLAWYTQTHQLLLYPESVYQRHIVKRDQWAFGIEDGRTLHAQFAEVTPALIERFFTALES